MIMMIKGRLMLRNYNNASNINIISQLIQEV
jgi:hypothetical protein